MSHETTDLTPYPRPDREGEDMKDSQSQPVLPSNGQTEAEPSAAADLAQLLRAFAKIEGFVRPPLVRSEAGLHSGSERLLVVKSHRWKNFAETVAKIDARHRQRVFAPAPVPPAEPGWQPISSAPRDGWVLVPREPTEEMIQAAIKRPNDSGDGLYADVYRAMVRAAPASTVQPAPSAACKVCGGTKVIRLVNNLYVPDYDAPCPTCVGVPLSAAGPFDAHAVKPCSRCGGEHAWGLCPHGPPTPSNPPPHKMQG